MVTKTAAKKTTAKKAAKKVAAASTPKSGLMAVIKTGGKQYVVQEGQILTVEKLPKAEEGKSVVFNEVLLIDDGKAAKVGTPLVSGAKVTAEVIENGRGSKITIQRFRAKSNYHRRAGHRQSYTKVRVTSIA